MFGWAFAAYLCPGFVFDTSEARSEWCDWHLMLQTPIYSNASHNSHDRNLQDSHRVSQYLEYVPNRNLVWDWWSQRFLFGAIDPQWPTVHLVYPIIFHTFLFQKLPLCRARPSSPSRPSRPVVQVSSSFKQDRAPVILQDLVDQVSPSGASIRFYVSSLDAHST